ncbi:MAG: hypothetical protein OQJ98_01625 [Candidatus Pacebacteria bacterium]|nr:hypothetical protein [Candidatus Paceibacterota bacterium]
MKKIFQSIIAAAVFLPYSVAAATGLKNPLRNINNFEDFVELLLEAVIRIGLPIAALFIVYSGLLFVTAQGSEDKIKKAKDVFFYTIVGVAVFLGSWTLAKVIQSTIKLLTG